MLGRSADELSTGDEEGRIAGVIGVAVDDAKEVGEARSVAGEGEVRRGNFCVGGLWKEDVDILVFGS